MKKLLLIFALFAGFFANAQTKLVAPLIRNNPADLNYGTHYDSLGYGGLVTFTSILNRDLHPMALRRKGMIAIVEDTLVFQLIGGFDNSNWVPVNFGTIITTTVINNFIDSITNNIDSSKTIYNYLTGIDSSSTRRLSGSVIWDSNLVFHNTPLKYLILGRKYTAAINTVTLTPSDPTYDRYSIIYADTLGNVSSIDGLAGAFSTVPQVDPESQILLGIYYIPHAATTPLGITNTVIYKENVEWVLSGTATGLNGNYTVNPYQGLKSTLVPVIIAGQYLNYTYGSTLTASDYGYLIFYLRLGDVFTTTTRLVVSFQNSGTAVSTTLAIANGSFGFDGTVVGQYQLIAIPMSALSFASQNFNQLHIALTGSNASGFQIDNIILQAGNVAPTPTGSVVNSFNNRTMNVVPQRIDYKWYFDSSSISTDGRKIIHWNNKISIDSVQFTQGPDTTMYDVRGFQVIQKGISGSLYDSVRLLVAAGTGVTIIDSSVVVNGITLYYKVFRSTATGSGSVTNVSALTLGTTGTDLSSSVANPTTTPVITLNVPTASAANRGALSAADWSIFNAKQPAGTYLIPSDTVNRYIRPIAGTNTTITGTYPNLTFNSSGGGGSVDSLVQLGTVYNKSSWASLADFTDVGTGATVSGTDVNITGGTNIFTEILNVKDTTLYDNWTMKVRFKINAAPSATSYGIGIGFNSINNAVNGSAVVKLDLSTGGSAGTLSLFNTGALTTTTSGTPITFLQNDSLELSLTRDGRYLTAYIQNLNNSTNTYTATYTYNFTTLTSTPPATGRFGIYRFGGNYNINKINILSSDRKYAAIGFIGDSKTKYNYVSDITKGYVSLTNEYLKYNSSDIDNTINFASASDLTSNILSRISVIIAAKPKVVFMAIGSNDKRTGVSNATWFSNYKSITSQLIAAGISVYHLLTFPENGFDFTAYKDSIIAQYPTTFIDTWNPLRTGTGLNALYTSDGIHMNDAGNLVIARQIVKSGLLDQYTSFKSKAKTDVPIGLGGQNIPTSIAIGIEALSSNNTGVQNFAGGYQALKKNTLGSYLTALGFSALVSNTTGDRNVAIGNNAMFSNTTGLYNTAVGANTLYSSITAGNSSAFGYQALYSNTSGGNSAFGYFALKANVSGANNAAFGTNALAANTADYNTAMGLGAMAATVSATQCTAFGTFSLGGATIGSYQSAFGINSLANSQGVNNSALGLRAGYNNLTGTAGIYLGYYSGQYNTAGDKQLFINSIDRTTYTADTTNSIIFGQQDITGTLQRLKLGGGGTVGINQYGTSTLAVNGSLATGYVAKSTSYTATISDNVIEVTVTGLTETLPTAVGCQGRLYTIKLTASGSSTIATTSSQTIDGSTTYSLSAQYKYVTVQSNNANWIIIGNN